LSADEVLEICQYVKYVWCRDLENRLDAQYKEARKLLTPTKYKIKHEEYDMHGEHYRDNYAVCPNCDKVFGNLYYDDGASDEFINRANEVYIKKFEDVKFCPNCGQKIDWNMDDRKIKED
jgi:NADH pyrophosphatase NudC (nudix superfamily)